METINQRIADCINEIGIKKVDFASRLNVSQAFISQLCKGTSAPSDRTIIDICEKFDINETWLRTGEGEMKIKYTRDEEIAGFAGRVLHGESDNFQRRFIAMLSRLDTPDWEVLEKMVLEMTKKED